LFRNDCNLAEARLRFRGTLPQPAFKQAAVVTAAGCRERLLAEARLRFRGTLPQPAFKQAAVVTAAGYRERLQPG
jgi:hypothetical protein